MPTDSPLRILIQKRDVLLDYPGSEGVTFQDAIFVVTNDAVAQVQDVVLSLRISQGDKALFEGDVSPSLLELQNGLGPGESLRMSVFRVIQKTVLGFASKVNLFGYKAVLNWSYKIVVSVRDDEALTKTIRWTPSQANDALVEVEIF